MRQNLWRPERDILASEKGAQLINVINTPVINHCLDMEQFVFVLASVYYKSLITQSVTKQELTKYQPSQNPA